MTLHEVNTTPTPEKIPPKILAAARHFSVDKYLQLRYQSNRGRLSKEEYQQISDAAEAIMYDVAKSDKKPYDPGDEIEPWADFRIGISRNIFKNTPFPVYLGIQHERFKAKGDDFKEDRDLIAKVAGAAGIALDAARS